MKLTVPIACFVLLAAAPAMAALFTEDFDSYVNGSSIHGQGGWEGWLGYAAVAGTITTSQASSGAQSLQVVRGTDTVRPFTGVSGGQWTLSMQQYIPSSAGGYTWTILMNQYPTNLNWSAQVLADISGGSIGVFDGTGTQCGSTLTLVKDAWVDLRFEINLGANTFSSYYNNILVGTCTWQNGGSNALQALDLYADESGETAQIGAVFYDNVQLVPEPATLSLLALGGLAMIRRRRN